MFPGRVALYVSMTLPQTTSKFAPEKWLKRRDDPASLLVPKGLLFFEWPVLAVRLFAEGKSEDTTLDVPITNDSQQTIWNSFLFFLNNYHLLIHHRIKW